MRIFTPPILPFEGEDKGGVILPPKEEKLAELFAYPQHSHKICVISITFMKTDIHPTYYPNAKVICACGNTFVTGSSKPELRVELCSNCHPFFTGTQRLVDTSRRVEKFQERAAKREAAAAARKGRVSKAKKQAAKKAKKSK